MSTSTKWRHYSKLAKQTLKSVEESNSDSSEVNEISSNNISRNEIDNISESDIVLSENGSPNDSEGCDNESIFSNNTIDFDFLSSESENDCSTSDIQREIAEWAVLFLIKNDALSALLCILRKHGLQLPKDARTVLKTPANLNILQKCGGSYIYFGLKKRFS